MPDTEILHRAIAEMREVGSWEMTLADWLNEVADRHPELPAWVEAGAIRIARAYLGEV